MGYVFTFDAMMGFLNLFSSPEGGSIYGFSRLMKEKYNVDENTSAIMWQSMDVVESRYYSIIKANTPKSKKILNQSVLYQCVECGKNTTGKKVMMEDLTEYLPRKHKTNGIVCPGSYKFAKQIVNEEYIEEE